MDKFFHTVCKLCKESMTAKFIQANYKRHGNNATLKLQCAKCGKTFETLVDKHKFLDWWNGGK